MNPVAGPWHRQRAAATIWPDIVAKFAAAGALNRFRVHNLATIFIYHLVQSRVFPELLHIIGANVKKISAARIGTRITVGFSAVLILMAALTLIGVTQVNEINAGLTTINDVNSVKQRYAINFRGSVHDRAIALRDVSLVSDPGEFKQTLDTIDRLTRYYAESAVAMDEMFARRSDISAQEREILALIKQTEAQTLPLIKDVVAIQQSGDAARAKTVLMTQARPQFVEWLARINKFIDLEESMNRTVADAARAVAKNFQMLMSVLCAIALVIGAAFAWWSIKAIRPLRRMTDAMNRLSSGDLAVEIPGVGQSDEVGDMATAMQVFKTNMIGADALKSEQNVERIAKEERAQRLTDLVGGFESKVAVLVRTLAGTASEVQATAASMSSAADQSKQQSGNAAEAAERAASSVQTVAAATERLAGSVREIGDRVATSRDIATRAISESEETRVAVGQLSDSANKIGEVVQLISTIAAQTNLLALNATIEAARAGEAGRGFAVVASEVKALASQTAQATEDIETKVQDIQSLTAKTVTAIEGIGRVVGDMSEIAIAIAAAIEGQSAATREIARTVQGVADGTATMSHNIAGVRQVSTDTESAATRMASSSSEMSDQASLLDKEVSSFIASVKAA